MGPGDKESSSWKVGGYFGVFAVVMLNLSVPGMAVVRHQGLLAGLLLLIFSKARSRDMGGGLALGLAALCIRGRVFPELAGLGKLKANSNVPSIARVSGQCLGRRSIRATGFVPAVSGGWRG